MGSAASKGSPSSSSSSGGSGARRPRSKVFGVSCFGIPSAALPDDTLEDHEKGSTCAEEIGSKSNREINQRSQRLWSTRHRKMPPELALCNAEVNGDDLGSTNTSQIELGASSGSGSSNVDAAAVELNASSRSRSRFGFIQDRIGFRLSRTISSGSSHAQSLLSETLSVRNEERNNCDFEHSGCLDVDIRDEAEDNPIGPTSSSQDNERDNTIIGGSVAGQSSRRRLHESGNDETRRYNQRVGLQEHLEGSVRFSRTLSVGRLRDRVLRRTSSSTGIFGAALVEDRSMSGFNGQGSERRPLSGRRRVPPSSTNEVWPDFARSHPYQIGSLTDVSYDSESGSSQLREGNGHDLVEHRSAFLERRRRIRSQVRALQRLGSRFENLSGHERACILSGQHRTGRCTCRAHNRVANSSDETGTRASISRIVMLAEALFEVLDEIHHQSVALSSRLSFSSIGSVPAPKEVVECMPVKVYAKPQKHHDEEAAQCYICLGEYEDGDLMRVLPCNHGFHRTCIDKWLKEIHRVCPLCRGDVCRSEASSVHKPS